MLTDERSVRRTRGGTPHSADFSPATNEKTLFFYTFLRLKGNPSESLYPFVYLGTGIIAGGKNQTGLLPRNLERFLARFQVFCFFLYVV